MTMYSVATLKGLAQGALGATLPSLSSLTMAQAWAALSPLPLGKQAFAQMIKIKIPYTGTIGAVVDELWDGHSKVVLRDRRSVRNHLDCVHAVALANLGEFCSGLAMFHAIDGKAKGIVTELNVKYLKKARGTLIAICDTETAAVTEPRTQIVQAIIRDKAGDVVCTVQAAWQLKPI
ncbi:MAG: DUF4442 domain-containing protein [Myxococcales bacterium]|nr:DUF4442 domain-containing protein [Myxococcales bacterium]